MSGAISASTLAMIGGGMAAGMLMTQSKPQAPQITPPEKPPAPAKAPERPAIGAAAAAAAKPGGAMAGNSSTFLTGPSGIDASTLNLGRNTLLGQ